MSTEERLIRPILASWKSINERFAALISRLSDEDLHREIAPGKNRVLYVVGHLAATNDRLFPLLSIGERAYRNLDSVYIEQPDRAVADPVAPAALRAASDDVARRLTEAFEKFSPDEWLEKHTAVSDEEFAKEPGRNRLAVVLSRTNHMSYHFGQIILAPKAH